MKKVLSILICVGIFSTNVYAMPNIPEIKSKSAVLYDLNGNKLIDVNGDEKLSPASVTKIMTMLLILENIEKGNLKLEDMVNTSAYASSMGGTQVYLKENEKMSVNDMLKSIAVASANDAAVAMSEHIAGSEEAFVGMMNEKAKELGMTNTNFVNANGLDMNGKITITSANDIAKMSTEILKYPQIRKYTEIWMDSIRGGEFELANTNKMLKNYPGCFGLKTGYTTEARYSISVGAERDGIGFIAVIMKAETKEDRTADATALLNYAFANYEKVDISVRDMLKADVIRGKSAEVLGETIESKYIVIPKEKAKDINKEININENLYAPIQKGDKIGEILIKSGEEIIDKFDITAKDTVEELTYFDIFIKMFKILFMQI